MKPLAVMLCCLGAWFTPAVAFGAAAASDPRTVTVKHLTPGARVSTMASDRRRFFWFGTEEGLVRYDGFALEPLRGPTMPTSTIFALCAAADGSLWIGTHGTKALRRLQEGAVAASTIQLPEGVTHVWAIVQGADEVFVGTNRGLFAVGLDLNAAPVPLAPLPNGEIRALLVARDQSLWVAHREGVGRLASDGISVVNTMPFPSALVQDSQGRVWAAHQSANDLLVYNESGKEVQRFKSRPTKALLSDMDGTVWIATENGLWNATGLRAPVNLDVGQQRPVEGFKSCAPVALKFAKRLVVQTL